MQIHKKSLLEEKFQIKTYKRENGFWTCFEINHIFQRMLNLVCTLHPRASSEQYREWSYLLRTSSIPINMTHVWRSISFNLVFGPSTNCFFCEILAWSPRLLGFIDFLQLFIPGILRNADQVTDLLVVFVFSNGKCKLNFSKNVFHWVNPDTTSNTLCVLPSFLHWFSKSFLSDKFENRSFCC